MVLKQENHIRDRAISKPERCPRFRRQSLDMSVRQFKRMHTAKIESRQRHIRQI